MLFNPQNQYDIQKADEYYKKLRNGDEPFEITQKSKKRTLSQKRISSSYTWLFQLRIWMFRSRSKG